MNSFKTLSAICWLGAVLASQSVHAHTLAGLTKESEAGISKYAVTCYNDGNGDAAKYAFQVKFTSPLPVGVKLTVNKAGQANGVTVDALKSGVFSPWGFNSGGNGGYVLTLTKIKLGASALGKVPFTIEHHCTAANGSHTGTSDVIDISPVDPGPVDPDPVDPPKPPVPTPSPAPGFSAALNKTVEVRRYAVECMAKKGLDTQRYRFRIRGVSKTAPFNARMTVSIDGSEGVEAMDPINTDANFSDWQEVAGGNNVYRLTIAKVSETGNTVGTLPFRVQHECVSETGSRTRLKGPKKLP